MRRAFWTAVWLLLIGPAWAGASPGWAEAPKAPSTIVEARNSAATVRPRGSAAGEERLSKAAEIERANAGTVTVISGGIAGTYIRIAADLASVLDDDDNLRILPVIGKGSLQNLRDLAYLRGIDLALVQSDTFENIRRLGTIPEINRQVSYVARLYNEEMHVLARNDIADVRALAGQKVNVDLVGSGTAFTAGLVFERLGIAVEPTNFDQALAYEKLKSGEIAAAVFVGGHPLRGIADFRGDGKFKLLAIPYDARLQDVYFPAELTSADYPNLIPATTSVETIAVGTVLAAFNWPQGSPRYKKLERFVAAFFSKFDAFLKPPRHPKWQEVNLAATVPGLQRFRAAQQWLDSQSTAATPTRHEFEQYLKETGEKARTPAEREKLFEGFLEWQKVHKH